MCYWGQCESATLCLDQGTMGYFTADLTVAFLLLESSYISEISWGGAVANNDSALQLLQREVQTRKRHTPDVSKVIQCLWQQPMGQQVQIRTLPLLLYQTENYLRKNLGSVPECNKRYVLCSIKFEIFYAVLISILTLKICIPYPVQWQRTIVLYGWLEKIFAACYVQGKLL